MLLQIFPTAALLHKFCVDNTIAQAKIVTIREVSGQWYLFYYV